MKKTWFFDIGNIKKKTESMKKELIKIGEEYRHIELNDEVQKDINRSGSNFLQEEIIVTNNKLHDRAIRLVGDSKSITRGLLDCIKKG